MTEPSERVGPRPSRIGYVAEGWVAAFEEMTRARDKCSMTSRETTRIIAGQGVAREISVGGGISAGKGHFIVHYMCCTRMAFRLGVRDSSSTTKDAGVVLASSAVERGDQVAVGGAGGGEFGDAFPEGAGFVGSREAGVVEDLFAEDFR
jgi:hypothetical protein